MFHRARDASKIALVHLVARLKAGGFKLLDTQFITAHLKTFGATEVHRRNYHKMLADALVGEADFSVFPLAEPLRGDIALARATSRRVGKGGPAV
jgi:leucyl/phenylalanyl-tRNA--protein transferase